MQEGRNAKHLFHEHHIQVRKKGRMEMRLETEGTGKKLTENCGRDQGSQGAVGPANKN